MRKILALTVSLLSAVFVTAAQGQLVPAGGETIAPAPSKYFTPLPEVNIDSDVGKLLHAEPPIYVLHPDDQISVKVYGLSAFDLKARIDEDGYVQLPLVGKVKLSGLRVSDAEDKINRLLLTGGMLVDPNTSIQVTDRPQQQVTVSGAVAKPGVFPAEGHHTLADYLSMAGEIKDTGSSTLTLTRPSLPRSITITLDANPSHSDFRQIPIFAGDEIHASSIGVIYVVGALKNQGAYPLKNNTPTTVMEAITLAGGIGWEAAASDTGIVRTLPSGDRQVMRVDVHRIMTGKSPDIPLRNDDIVYVPTNATKAAVKGGAASIIVSFASAYIYAAH